MLLLILIFLCPIVYILMIAPKKPDLQTAGPFLDRYYAHRGLYSADQRIAENTLPAFELAASRGYGIELDIRLSKDHQIVVLHDDTLLRAAGIDRPVETFTYTELAALPLYGTDAHIPLFSDVLATVNGRVPLIVEFKAGYQDTELCRLACELLRSYTGPYCVESFDPRIIRWFRQNAPQVFRGQLACSVRTAASGTPRLLAFLASRCMLNFLSRPNFIAYELIPKPFSVSLAERLGAVPACWTSRSHGDAKGNQMIIFEFYEPETMIPLS